MSDPWFSLPFVKKDNILCKDFFLLFQDKRKKTVCLSYVESSPEEQHRSKFKKLREIEVCQMCLEDYTLLFIAFPVFVGLTLGLITVKLQADEITFIMPWCYENKVDSNTWRCSHVPSTEWGLLWCYYCQRQCKLEQMDNENYSHDLLFLMTETCEMRFLSISSCEFIKLSSGTTANTISCSLSSERKQGKKKTSPQ